MDGEEKLFLIIVCVMVIGVTILYSFLFIALWDYRQWVGLSLLAVAIAGAAVFLRGKRSGSVPLLVSLIFTTTVTMTRRAYLVNPTQPLSFYSMNY